jgi:hypothetical protein
LLAKAVTSSLGPSMSWGQPPASNLSDALEKLPGLHSHGILEI